LPIEAKRIRNPQSAIRNPQSNELWTTFYCKSL
jgi:glucose/arabinose dehydrogenase